MPWAALEARKAIIGKIVVEIGDVFDLTKPDENTLIGRTADHLHASTKESVIRRVLLFQEGDPVRARRLYETERLLRALPFVKDAHIDPVVEPDGTVVARVRVRDAWTTQVNASFSSVGGQRSTSLGVDEKNFMGMGKDIALDYSKDFQRNTYGITYNDPQFLGSRWTLMAQDQLLSDGSARTFAFGRPFFALDTPWSTSTALTQKHTSLYLYNQGAQVFQMPFVQDEVQWAGAVAFHESGDRVWRGGLSFHRQDTSYGAITQTGPPGALLPPVLTNRRLRGPALTLSTEKDAFESFYDLQGMDTPEDYNLSWNGSLELGTYSRSLGSSMNAPYFLLQAANGWSSSAENLTLFTASVSGRAPASGLENGQVNLALMQYCKLTSNQILAGLAAVDLACRLDPENWYYVGGDQGLRGFPNQLRPGDARWLLSCDYRLLTEQRWWGLVRLGYNAFVDVGAVRQFNGQGWTRPYSDVGAGFRLGNLKSSLGRVILLSFAVPLNREPYQARYQVTIGNTIRF
ncbi:MAG: hypothetical protein ABSH53_18365 [Holophaga sp.]